jgi:malate dehydrogenase (oxaloacetate-decarboxylating)
MPFPDKISLLDVVRNAKPTVLIGVSGQGGMFSEAVIRAMAAGVERPVVFPLSNPTSCAEATPQDVMNWTEGRAVIGTGSPFPPVTVAGRTCAIAQTNNAYVFPAWVSACSRQRRAAFPTACSRRPPRRSPRSLRP